MPDRMHPPADRRGPAPRGTVILLGALAGALLLAWGAAAAAPGVPEVRTLPDGLQVVLFEDHALPIAAASLWVHAGSKDEIESSAGFAHFLEHLVQRGSEGSAAFEYQRRANRWGGSLSVRSNYDRTFITLTGASSALDDMLAALAGMAFHATLQDPEIDLELGPLSQEIRNFYDLPASVQFLETMRLTFPDHPYKYPMLGNYRTLGRLKGEPLAAFYRNLYVPNNMALALVGDFDPKKAMALVEAALGKVPRSATLPPKPPPPSAFAGHNDVEKRLDLKEPSASLSFAGPGYRHPDRAAFEVIARALGEAGGAPIQAAVLRAGAGSAPYVTYYGLEDCGMLYLGLKPDTPVLAYDAARAALAEIVAFKQRGLKDAEVRAFADRLMREERLRAEQWSSRAEDLAEAALFGGVRYSWGLPDVYARLTSADVARVARKYLVQENLRLGVILPKGTAPIPDEPKQRFHEVFDQLDKADPAAPPDFRTTNFPAAQASMVDAAAWGNPKDAAGLKAPQKAVLENGMTIVTLEDHRQPLVGVSLQLGLGSGEDPAGKEGLANVIVRLLAARAAASAREQASTRDPGTFSAPSIQIGRDLTEARLMTGPAGLEPALVMLAAALLHPPFSLGEFEAARKAALDAASLAGRDPAIAALDLFRENVYAGHPYSSPPEGTGTSIKGLSLEDAAAFDSANLRPGEAVIAVVGDIAGSETVARIRSLFGGWRGGAAPEKGAARADAGATGASAAAGGPTPRPGQYSRQMAGAQSHVLLGVQGARLGDPDFQGLRFLGTALTVLAFEDMVFQRRTAFSAVALPEGLRQGGSLAVDVASLPSRRDETVFDLQRLMRRLALEDLPAADLQDIARMQAARGAAGLQGVAALASTLAFREASGLGARSYREEFDPVPAMTASRLKELAARYLRPEAWIVVTIGPPSS